MKVLIHLFIYLWESFVFIIHQEIKPWRLHFFFDHFVIYSSKAKQSSCIQNFPNNTSRVVDGESSLCTRNELAVLTAAQQTDENKHAGLAYACQLANYHKIYELSFYERVIKHYFGVQSFSQLLDYLESSFVDVL